MKTLQPRERIILPYDKSELSRWDFECLDRLRPHVGGIKIGLEAIFAPSRKSQITVGFRLLNDIKHRNQLAMWDGKYNDIPNTVGNAVKNTAACGVWGMTVMASAGSDSMKAAVANRGNSLIIGVTVLTSLSERQCKEIYGRCPRAQVLYFADMLLECGAQAIVCSPLELETVRKVAGDKLICITPGIRLKDAPHDDQNRTMTPGDAIKAGADYLVIGRPIMQVSRPVTAAKAIGEEIASATSNLSMV